MMKPCLDSIKNLIEGTASQIKTVLEQSIILPSMVRIIRKLETATVWKNRSSFDSTLDYFIADIYWIVGNIACHSDQIDSLLESGIMSAVINRFGQKKNRYNTYDNESDLLRDAARAIDEFVSHGSFTQIARFLDGDDCIRYLFRDDYWSEEWHYNRGYEYVSAETSPILTIINIIKNLLIKHEKNRQQIKSTIGQHKELNVDDMKEHGLVRYDLFEKIEGNDGIRKIKNLQNLEQHHFCYSTDKEEITEATIDLLDFYSKMKEKAESEKKIEVVDPKMKKVTVNSNQSKVNEVLPRRMTLRSSKR